MKKEHKKLSDRTLYLLIGDRRNFSVYFQWRSTLEKEVKNNQLRPWVESF
ncbi:hypothetical protein PI95_009190 [Hassallia byssoidea VB512170]|uniref:Uncharacterized protein n=1 Tax=Hassallia byssoidea VB512170 TaxID=1304833 RepID=A0A846H802_9CYAN|nr:hypothetical protein [Hassalia byssoidea]NEU72740.1 hypothetical protein [Hassalia byssoidea VB512170]